jgi:hypothetical protein
MVPRAAALSAALELPIREHRLEIEQPLRIAAENVAFLLQETADLISGMLCPCCVRSPLRDHRPHTAQGKIMAIAPALQLRKNRVCGRV